jgi:hypothetical protein
MLIIMAVLMMVPAPPVELRATFARVDAPIGSTFPIPASFTIDLKTHPLTVDFDGKSVVVNDTSLFFKPPQADGKVEWPATSHNALMATVQALKKTSQFPEQFMLMRTRESAGFKPRPNHAQAGNRTCRQVGVVLAPPCLRLDHHCQHLAAR